MPHSSIKPSDISNPVTPNISAPRERRHRSRVLLEMPVRIRWLGPFGLETEITQTCNVSRSGLLVSSAGSRQAGSLLWATFPYDAGVYFTESETPGKVVRCGADMTLATAQAATTANTIAIAFHHLDLNPLGGALLQNNSSNGTRRNERRHHARIVLAFLIRVERSAQNPRSAEQKPEQPPWSEETMTLDVSPAGMLFYTLRIHQVGEDLIIAVQSGRKFSAANRKARVVRVNPAQKGSPLSYVAIEFLS